MAICYFTKQMQQRNSHCWVSTKRKCLTRLTSFYFFVHSAFFYSRGSDTILGETSDVTELFLVDECDNNPLGSIVQKCTVS